jgi:hypothetical protein
MRKMAIGSNLGRRQFLRAVGAGASVAAAAPATAALTKSEISERKTESGYRESESIKTFYRVNRYPS